MAKQKVFAEQEVLVLELRRSRRLGIKQLRSELLRQHGLGLSLDTLHRILVRHGEQHLKPNHWPGFVPARPQPSPPLRG